MWTRQRAAAPYSQCSELKFGAAGAAGYPERVSYPFQNAYFQWEEGWRVLQGIDGDRNRRRAERVIDAVREELRRRIGPTFTAEQLADLYGSGTDWCLQAALEVAPELELDCQALADAAFWLYLRGASDFAAGRRLVV